MAENYKKLETALITGATGGLGEILATRLSKYYEKLILVGRNLKKLRQLEFKINKSEVRIKIGMYNGIINLLYSS